MLLTIGTAASPGGSLQIRIGPVPSLFEHVWNGPPVVTVKGAVTTAALTGVVTTASVRGNVRTPSLAATIATPSLRGTITTPSVVGISEA